MRTLIIYIHLFYTRDLCLPCGINNNESCNTPDEKNKPETACLRPKNINNGTVDR